MQLVTNGRAVPPVGLHHANVKVELKTCAPDCPHIPDIPARAAWHRTCTSKLYDLYTTYYSDARASNQTHVHRACGVLYEYDRVRCGHVASVVLA